MTASGSMIEGTLAAIAAVNATALPGAVTSYSLMLEILQNDAQPLIFASLAISAGAIVEGLAAYEATLADAQRAYARIPLDPPQD